MTGGNEAEIAKLHTEAAAAREEGERLDRAAAAARESGDPVKIGDAVMIEYLAGAARDRADNYELVARIADLESSVARPNKVGIADDATDPAVDRVLNDRSVINTCPQILQVPDAALGQLQELASVLARLALEQRHDDSTEHGLHAEYQVLVGDLCVSFHFSPSIVQSRQLPMVAQPGAGRESGPGCGDLSSRSREILSTNGPSFSGPETFSEQGAA